MNKKIKQNTGDIYSLGHCFLETRKRWRNFEVSEEIIELFEEMKNKDKNLRPSIDKILERLVIYCDKKNYSDSIDIIPYLKENKTFIQTPFNENISTLKETFEKKNQK